MGSVLFSRHAHTVRKCQVVGALVCCAIRLLREGRKLINMIRLPYSTRQHVKAWPCQPSHPMKIVRHVLSPPHQTTAGEKW